MNPPTAASVPVPAPVIALPAGETAGAFPFEGGAAGAAIRAHDWADSPLGSIDGWPAALRHTLGTVLALGFPAFVVWGPQRILLYNDAYAGVLFDKHPHALGRDFLDVWNETRAALAPLVERAMAGETLYTEDLPLLVDRKGYTEQTYFTYSYAPIRDIGDGRVLGFMCNTLETSGAVLARRQRDASEAALRRSEAEARQNAERVQLALAAGAIIGTWVWDLVRDRFTVDEAFARAFGLDPALGREGLSLAQVVATVHPEDQAGLAAAIGDVRARGGPYAHQYRVRREDGRYYWIEANGRVELDADGKGVRFPGVLIDVERRRSIEAERDNAISKLRALNAELEQKVIAQALARGRTWQLSPDILCVLNADGYFEATNPAWETTLGWFEDEVARTGFFDFVLLDDLARTRAAWHELVRGGLPALRFENRCRHKDGGWRWLSWVAVTDGARVYCSARDITEAKAAETELVARTLERDRMWNTAPDLMLIIGADGVFQRVNPAWTRLLGYAAAELVGRHMSDFILPEDLAPSLASYAENMAGDALRVINRYRHKDGSVRWISWAAVPAGDVVYATGWDITGERERQAELEKAQEQLRQAQKMEAVGQLTGGLAHDFNNLLAGISGSLELIAMRIKQGRPQDLERYMTVALGATRRAAALTHRLLAFSRRQTLAPRATDANGLVASMLDMIRRTVGPSVQVQARYLPELWPTLVDQSQLENALLNLCINARDAMPDGGQVTIATANRPLDANGAREIDLPPGDYIVLAVTDTGTGMTPDVIAKAFDPFFTTKPLGQGTGLGLSMIYGFANQSGGQVRIHSTVGHGTTVSLYLPRHRGEAERDEAPRRPAPVPKAQAGETVLIVDDEPAVRMLVVDVLKELGYTALEAADGAAGLRILQSDARIDLLVTDVGLPGLMNGRQMADAGRVGRPGLQVLFITGFAETALLTDGQLEPGMAVLTKPFSMDTLAASIRRQIARPAPRDYEINQPR